MPGKEEVVRLKELMVGHTTPDLVVTKLDVPE